MGSLKFLRTKSPAAILKTQSELKQCLSATDLVLIGIGAIIGAGIFVLTGIAAATKAGPGVTLSYVFAGIASSFAALAYAELAASIGGSGSAYNYSYVGLGELFAWIIGWDLLLEYGVGASTVAIGWSGYLNNGLTSIGIQLPYALLNSPFEGGIINLPAVLIILILSAVLAAGVKQSARFNALIVTIKLSAIAVFIWIGYQYFNPNTYWEPFLPFGWEGVAKGAGLVFFAYIGFDVVSTTAEEAIKPQRDLTIGIIGSLLICTALYLIVAALLTGIASYTSLNVESPVAESILRLGHPRAAGMISLGAIAGLTSVILIFIYGFTRVFYAISRDGLLPMFFSKLNPTTKTPLRIIVFCAVIMALIAGFLPLSLVAELVNIGTLAAFILVSAGVILLRYTAPNLARPFKLPLNPLLPLLGIVSCVFLMLSLPWMTWLRFAIWMALGLCIYFGYGYSNSRLSN